MQPEDPEEKYRKFVEDINSIIIGFDAGGKITFFNHFAEKLFGWSRGEMLGKDFVGAVIPLVESSGKDNSGLVADVIRAPEKHCLNESEGVKRNGGRVLFSWSAKDVRDRQGNLVEVLVDGNDLTPMREQMAAARKAYVILDSSPDVIAEIDKDGRYRYVNKAMERLVGRPKSEIVGKQVGEFGASEETVAVMRNAFRKAAETKNQESYESKYGGKALLTSVVPEFDGQGGISSFMAFTRDITEREKTEEVLRDSQDRYSQLFNAKLYGIAHCRMITDERGKPVNYRIMKVNDTYLSIIGLKREQIDGKLVTDVFPGIEKMPAGYIQKYGRIALEGGELIYEDFFPATNQWLEIYAYQPKHGEFAAIFTDITRRKQAEEALRKERELLLGIIDSIPVMLTIYDPDVRNIQVNRHFMQVTGWSREDAAQDLSAKVYPDPKERDAVMQFMQSLSPGWRDLVMTAKDGSKIESSWANVGLPDGRQVGIGLDIRERKRDEAALRESETRLHAIFDNLAEGVVVVDPRGGILNWNPAALRMHGYEHLESEIEFLNKVGEAFALTTLDGKPIPFDQWPINRMLRGENFRDYDIYVRNRKQGWQKVFTYNGTLLCGENGDQLLGFLSIRDITERKKAEDALRESQRRYSALFSTKSNGIVHWKAIADAQGKPVDLKFLDVNNAYEKIIGLKKEEVVGKLLTEVFPGIENSPKDYIGKYGGIALRGGEMVWEDYFEPTHVWVSDYVYSPLPGEVTVLFTDISERKKAETELRRSDEIIRSVSSAILTTDRDGNITYINDFGLKFFGYTRDELMGKNVIAALVPERESTGRELYPLTSAIIKNPDQSQNFVNENIKKNGERVWVSWTNRSILDAEGHLAGVFTVGNDITLLKQIENELRTSEERFRTMADNISQLIWTAEASGLIDWFNKRWYDYTGKSFEELKGWGWLKVLHPDYVQKVTEKTGASIRNGEVFEDYFLLRGKDGQYRWFLSRAIPIKDTEGRVIRWFGTETDITQLRETQERLSDAVKEARRTAAEAAEGQRTLATLMDNIPEGIFIAEPSEGRLQMVSRYMTELTGIPQQEFNGLADAEVKSKLRMQEASLSATPKELPLLRAVRKGEIVVDDEWTINPPGRNAVDVLINARPIHDSSGAITGGVASWRDITGRKKAEDTLRRNEYELRTLVDNSPDIIFRLNRQLQYTYVNPAYERITGVAKEEFIGKTNDQLGMSRRMMEFWQSAVQPVIEEGREQSVEFDMDSIFGKRYFYAGLIPEFEKSGLVETVLVIARDITERKRAEEQVRYISFHDEVTGLFNRAFFEEEIRRVDTERDLPISIIMGDVNNLKLTNDVFGHDEGDALLKAIADSIHKACRQSDIVARWGGDEFAVILPKTDFVTADGICARIGEITREHKDTVLPPSVAVGIAAKERRDQNIYQTIRQAEQYMYEFKLDHAEENRQAMFAALLNCAREKIPEYAEHIHRSYELACRFGDELGLPEEQQRDLRSLVELHDIGYAAVPREILAKPGRLTVEEWDIMKKHVEAGFRIVKTYADTARISDEVLSHGERWDGSGYPRALAGKDIPYLARIFAVIDAFDAMTHSRPYARTLSRDEAVEELRRNAGKQFDPELVKVFIDRVAMEPSKI